MNRKKGSGPFDSPFHKDTNTTGFDAPLHPRSNTSNYAAGDLTSKDDHSRVDELYFILGITNIDKFLELFIQTIKRNRYRGFVRVYICEVTEPGKHKELFSWFYRKFDVYLVALDDGLTLYEVGKIEKYRWLRSAQLTGFTERYSDLFAKNDKDSGEKEENQVEEKEGKKSKERFSWFNSSGFLLAIRDGISLHGSRKNQWVTSNKLRGYCTGYEEVYLKGQGTSENNQKKQDIKEKAKKTSLYGVVLSSAKLFEAVCQVKDNIGQPFKWRTSFGYFSLIAEAARFKWVRKVVVDVMLYGEILVLGEEKFEWGSFVPMIWAEASSQVHKIKDNVKLLEMEIACPPYTLEGALEMSTNPRAAYEALSLIAWDEKDILKATCENHLIEPHLSLALKIESPDSDQLGDQLQNEVPMDVRELISMRYILDSFDYTCGKVLAKFTDSRYARHVGLENQRWRDSEKDGIMCELEKMDIPEPPTLLEVDLELWRKIFGVKKKIKNAMCKMLKYNSNDGQVIVNYVILREAVDASMELKFISNSNVPLQVSGSIIAYYGDDVVADYGSILGEFKAVIFQANNFELERKEALLKLHKSGLAVPANGCLKIVASLKDLKGKKIIVNGMKEYRAIPGSTDNWKMDYGKYSFNLKVAWSF